MEYGFCCGELGEGNLVICIMGGVFGWNLGDGWVGKGRGKGRGMEHLGRRAGSVLRRRGEWIDASTVIKAVWK